MQDYNFGLLKYWFVGSAAWIAFALNAGWDRELLPVFAYVPPAGFLLALIVISWAGQAILRLFSGAKSKRLS